MIFSTTADGCMLLCGLLSPVLAVTELENTLPVTAVLPPPIALPTDTPCVWAASSAVVNVCVSAPPVLPTALPRVAVPVPPEPTATRRRKSGSVNVVEPSPTPQVVPIAVKSAA